MRRKIGIGILIALVFGAFFILGGFSLANVLSSRETLVLEALDQVREKLQGGKNAFVQLDFARSAEEFSMADAYLKNAKRSLGPFLPIGFKLARFLPESALLRQVLESISIGEEFTLRSKNLSNAALKLQGDFPTGLFQPDGTVLPDLKRLRQEVAGLQEVISRVSRSKSQLRSQHFLEKFESADTLAFLEKLDVGLRTFEWVLGGEGPRTILLLFQNPAEIRPTGGFLSGFGIVKVEQGKILDFDFFDSAEVDARTTAKIMPPRPLRRIARSWLPSDANWFLDFPTSAAKLAFFLENAVGIRGDAIVAVNPSVIAALLAASGPLEIPEYGATIDRTNFWEEALVKTREDFLAGRPKRFLQFFGARFLEQLKKLPSESLTPVLRIFSDGFGGKDLQAYAIKKDIAMLLREKGWDGSLPGGETSDFLSIVHTNIGGEKSDYKMKNNFSLLTEIAADGTIKNTVKIVRVHSGSEVPQPFFRARNYDYVRVYVPQGAELLKSSGGNSEPTFSRIDYETLGYAIDEDLGLLNAAKPVLVSPTKPVEAFEEGGKTVFATWLITDPGEKNQFELTYRLPFATGFDTPSYQIIIEKQSGISAEFSHAIEIPEEATLLRGALKASGMLEKRTTRGISFQFPSPSQ